MTLTATILTVCMALIAIAISSYTRKKEERDKPLYLVWVNIACLVGIVIVNAANHLDTSTTDKAYKKAGIELEVLARANEYAIPVFESLAEIVNNFNPVKNYIYKEQAKIIAPEAVFLLEEQQRKIRQTQSFLEAEDALSDLKSIAAQIQFLDLQYENVMPKEMIEWSALVLKIRLENMDDYFDPYVRNGDSPDESVTQFFELTGNAFGASLGKARRAAEIIISSTK